MSRAGAGLERWRSLAEQTVAVARQVAEANARPWRRRQELQGLLRATRVKAGAMGRAEDPLVSDLAGQAARSLAVPCDLPAAESAIEALLEGLRQPVPSSAADSSVWTQADPAHAARPRRWPPRRRADGWGRRHDRRKPLRAFAGCGGSLDGGYCDTCGRTPLAAALVAGPPPSPALRSSAGPPPVAGSSSASDDGSGAGGRCYARPRLRPTSVTHRLGRPEGARRPGLRRGGQPPDRGHTAGARPRRRPRRPHGRSPGGGHAGRPGSRGQALLLQVAGRALPQPPAGTAGGILPPVPDPVLLHASARSG